MGTRTEVWSSTITLRIAFDGMIREGLNTRVLLDEVRRRWPHFVLEVVYDQKLAAGYLVAAQLIDVPGTYDEFPAELRKMCASQLGLFPEQISIGVRPHNDYWE